MEPVVRCCTTPSRLLYPPHGAPVQTTALVAAGLWPTRPGSRDDQTTSRPDVSSSRRPVAHALIIIAGPRRLDQDERERRRGERSVHGSRTVAMMDCSRTRPPDWKTTTSGERCVPIQRTTNLMTLPRSHAPTPSASAIEPHFTFILQYIGSHHDQGGLDHAVDMCPRLSPATHAGESFLFRSFLPFRSQSASQCGHYIRGRLSQARL